MKCSSVKFWDSKSTVAKENIYLESGKYPLAFTIMLRRLLYYWHILQRDRNELISRVLFAQKYQKGKDDWLCLVLNDLKSLKIKCDKTQIQSMSN